MVEQNINEVEPRKEKMQFIEIPNTISCIELTMRHDKRGYVIGWMEGNPKTDSWDGSIDNQIIVLEDKEPERRCRKFMELK
ncbi:MAG: hypothetical protein ACTSXC_04615 [Candidatus Freyarchaeota archaeon]